MQRHFHRFTHNLPPVRALGRPTESPTVGLKRATALVIERAYIGEVAFICPTTRLEARAGIHMDSRSFVRLGEISTRFRCAACGQQHMSRLDGGSLAPLDDLYWDAELPHGAVPAVPDFWPLRPSRPVR